MKIKKYILSVGIALVATLSFAKENSWKTHFAYNSVEIIANCPEEVFALSNGAIFSINKTTESMTLYNNQSGLHGTNICFIMHDDERKQLLIMYSDGKMDILYNGTMHYISDLYNKRMTSSKKCNNITIQGQFAYLAMDFGILVFDLEKHEFKETYYIGEEASEIKVTDIMFYGDSIFAQTRSNNYSACIHDNVVDYHFWSTCSVLPCPFDTKKGKEYTMSDGDLWKVAGKQGVYRKFVTGEEAYYLPDGPQVNTPYSMTFDRGRLYVVPGGRWANQNGTEGHVMIYENDKWLNITNAEIKGQTGKRALDFMNVAVDPDESGHFFVTSYGTGVYEFRDDVLVKRYTPSNSILGSAAPSSPDSYTRTSYATYDQEGRLWINVDGGIDTTLVAFLPDGTQRGINFYPNNARLYFNTSGGLIIDNSNPNRKWVLSCRANPIVAMIDDGGTPFDQLDDQFKAQSEFFDQDGNVIVPEFYYEMRQAPNGDIWIGSSSGPIIIPYTTDFLKSTGCKRLRIPMADGNYLLETERVNTFAFDNSNKIWIGTAQSGIYVLNEEATEIVAHYTSENTVMPSNTVISLAFDDYTNRMYIGTGGGLVSYKLSADTALNSGFSEEDFTNGTMYQWKSHLAYSEINQVAKLEEKIYALSNNSLFSVNKRTEEIEYYTKATGLSSSLIDHIEINKEIGNMLITYQNGHLDIMDAQNNIHNISDLFLKPLNISKQVHDICMYGNKAYLAMNFGIIVLDMKKYEIEDTYYIGDQSTEVDVAYITILGDSIYAASNTALYSAHLNNNLVDYAFWKKQSLPSGKSLHGMRAYKKTLCVIKDNTLWSLNKGNWKKHSSKFKIRGFSQTENHLFVLINQYGIAELHDDFTTPMTISYGYINEIIEDGSAFWLGTRESGVVHHHNNFNTEYHPEGPLNNYSYRLRTWGNKLYMLPGGRWAAQYNRPADIMILEDNQWTNITNGELAKKAGHAIYDAMNVAQDPNDPSHYFITTYGTGMIEMQDTNVVKLHLASNSNFHSAVSANPDFYTRTDGIMYDEQNNLWVLNAGGNQGNVHVISPDGRWTSFDLNSISLDTPGDLIMDLRNPQWKWISIARAGTGLILLQDNGTPHNPNDDKITFRNTWIDQNSRNIAPENIYSIAQDYDNTLWVGTNSGVFTIPSHIDFAASNQCERIVIPRNDGSGLGDYLLDGEQINCIAIDGANRKWIGTASSGVFLIQITTNEMGGKDIETVAHFTTENSLMPSDNVLSIAINELSGEVFIGTAAGLVSYMSDAIEPEENFNNLYAYPNPVHPTYRGHITIKGLMVDTQVRILDAAGNLVKILEGQGGAAVWDGNNARGQRVASGVYTAVCNTKSGENHNSVKILIMN